MNWKKPIQAFTDRIRPAKKEDEQPDEIKTTVETENEVDRLSRKLNELFSEKLSISGDVDSLINNIQSHLHYCGGQYHRAGLYHGESGSRDFHVRSITDAHATLTTERVNSALGAQSDAHDFIIGEKRKDLVQTEQKQVAAARASQTLKDQSVTDPKQFNRVNAWVYLISGFAMILADIAVSVNLVAFFGVGNPKGISTFKQKLMDPELMFFSLGIALCTVFIKIFYDEYINNKLGQTQRDLYQLEQEGISRSSLATEYVIKLVVKFLILTALLVLLYYLAKYRTYFTFDKEFGFINHMRSNQDVSGLPDVMLKSFIGITLVIPVVSGIALSSGLKIFSNRRSMKEVVRQEAQAVEENDRLEEELKSLIFKQKQIEKYWEEWKQKPQKVTLISDFFAYNYDQGFRHGYRQTHGNDLYKLIEEFRNEVINQAFTKQLRKQV